MVSFGVSKHFPINPLQSIVNETKPKLLYDPPNALYTMLAAVPVGQFLITNSFISSIQNYKTSGLTFFRQVVFLLKYTHSHSFLVKSWFL